jgi:hypothetical protein
MTQEQAIENARERSKREQGAPMIVWKVTDERYKWEGYIIRPRYDGPPPTGKVERICSVDCDGVHYTGCKLPKPHLGKPRYPDMDLFNPDGIFVLSHIDHALLDAACKRAAEPNEFIKVLNQKPGLRKFEPEITIKVNDKDAEKRKSLLDKLHFEWMERQRRNSRRKA